MADKPQTVETGDVDAKGNPVNTGSRPSEAAKTSRADTLASAKYDPRMQGGGMSQDQVQAAGGLAAVIAARKKKQQATQATQAEALESK